MRKKRPESVDRSGDADAAQDGKHTKKASSERSMHVANGRAERVATSPAAGNGLRRSRRKRSINAVSGVVAGADNVGPSSRTASASPAKKRRQSSKYAPPSKYAHLKPLTDILEPNLICVFVGFNPGVKTAQSGHAYAHPSNMFWKLLHSSGCTDERLKPEQDVDLPRLYSMGNTNIVARPSKDAAELSKAESAAGTPILEEKVRKYRPEAVCIVGKGIWESIWRWRYKREIQKHEFRYGWQDEKERIGRTDDWPGAVVFVATATSGLAANLRPHEKEAIWKPFGDWVKQRRRERNFATSVFGPDR
ncbi:hypothetical protein AC579_3943 [Pseudocercospora musae]|uniref:Uracil-DNA glycosylase-like domain-containing protein n=1 Tax=Pseudocercospora musae TaxID=113226 RepID=A0A139IKF6_9PEZI|nr:hypothetical protein AC579_3943 [Pseudocercospora musae]